MSEIREAAAAVRETFDTPYGLVPKRIATDGVDIFVEHGLGDLRRARDGQPPSRRSWRNTFATCVGSGRRLPEVGCEPVLESAVPDLVGGAAVAQSPAVQAPVASWGRPRRHPPAAEWWGEVPARASAAHLQSPNRAAAERAGAEDLMLPRLPVVPPSGSGSLLARAHRYRSPCHGSVSRCSLPGGGCKRRRH